MAAADQFLVRRASTGGSTVIAGYHWFDDWGRDTMISLPGPDADHRPFRRGTEILRTFARYSTRACCRIGSPRRRRTRVQHRRRDALVVPRARPLLAATGDLDLAREQLPLLIDVVEWHLRGTRYGIVVDPTDGLLLAGEPGVQLTWMDARVGERVVTPRHGKPVEVQALWCNALSVLAELSEQLGQDGSTTPRWPSARGSACRLLDERGGYLYDVLGPDGDGDPTLRPNQLIALGLPRCAIDRDTGGLGARGGRGGLLTPYGPRTLAPG